RCQPGGAGCAIGQPISMAYTMTDTISTASSSIDLKIGPSPINPLSLPPALNFAVTDQGIVMEDTIGMLLPTANFVINGPLLFDSVTGLTTVPIGTAYPCQQDPQGTCVLETRATMSIPQVQAGHNVVGINLSQSLDVVGSSAYRQFRSVQILQSDPAGGNILPYGGPIGALVQIERSSCYVGRSDPNDGQGSGEIVDCVQEGTGPLTGSQIIALVGQNNVNVYYILGAR